MAEFQEVMRQVNRICSYYQAKCEDSGCLLRNVCGVIGNHSSNKKQAMQIEELAMKWAAEHPEPVYPTWYTWLIMMGAVGSVEDLFSDLQRPIPADIAERLGIEPKEGI
jgi:hypothetical protein